jgi:hypothetical protein
MSFVPFGWTVTPAATGWLYQNLKYSPVPVFVPDPHAEHVIHYKAQALLDELQKSPMSYAEAVATFGLQAVRHLNLETVESPWVPDERREMLYHPDKMPENVP